MAKMKMTKAKTMPKEPASVTNPFSSKKAGKKPMAAKKMKTKKGY